MGLFFNALLVLVAKKQFRNIVVDIAEPYILSPNRSGITFCSFSWKSSRG